MKNLVTRFVKDQSGATAIEYALLAAMIAIVLIAGAKQLGTAINTEFTNIAGEL